MTDDEAYAFLLKVESGIKIDLGEWAYSNGKPRAAFWMADKQDRPNGVYVTIAGKQWMREYEKAQAREASEGTE